MTTFGTSMAGEDVTAHEISAGDLRVTVLSWGACVQDVRLAGVDYSLTLGSDKLSDYEGDMLHHGTLIGPIVNRISTGRVTIDGFTYELERNQDGRICLHSGSKATHRRNWTVVDADPSRVTLKINLTDGECGLPGNREIVATYSVEAPAKLVLTLEGTTDAKTLMNFANHSYWNLNGSDRIEEHTLRIAADEYLPTDNDFCPTGEIKPVAGTNMDFRTGKAVTRENPPLDNNFCLGATVGPLRDVLELSGVSGVTMVMATDQLGLQLYDGRNGQRPGRPTYEGLAIEAQNWPDAHSHDAFPSIEITPERSYQQTTTWRFSAGS